MAAAFIGVPVLPATSPMIGFRSRKGDIKLNEFIGTSARMHRKPMFGKISYHLSSNHLCLRASAAISPKVNVSTTFPNFDPLSLKGMGLTTTHCMSAATSLVKGNHVTPLTSETSILLRRHTMMTVVPRAYSGITYGSNCSRKIDKPKWWMRSLACIPYLMPLHLLSLYADEACQYFPFMTDLQMLMVNPFTGSQLPAWFSMVYFFAVFYGVVRNDKLSKFFRFHVVMAMLFENAINIIGTASSWFPYAKYWGQPFWTVVSFAFFFAVFECIRHSLQGLYPDIPFFSSAAAFHIR